MCSPKCVVAQQQQPRDLAALFDGIDLRLPESAFMVPPREIVRPLMRSKKLMAAGKFSDAVEILGELLADDSMEDFLIPRGTRSFTSLRSRTESILGAIDTRLLERYQIRYGIRARKLMEKGVAENDLSLLKKVSSQFFFTDSGAESTMLLGHMELSNGQPSAAQSYFAKIVRFPATAAKHDPEASILLATCQLLGNNQDAAKETLADLKRRLPNSTISLMGESYTLFNREKDAISWLKSLIGDSPLASNRMLSEWLMFQGNPARTGKTGTGMPLIAPRWEHATSKSLEGQREASKYVTSLIQDGTMPAPAVTPLVVGETIVLRDVDQMYGIDFETGLRKWAWPPELAWNQKSLKGFSSSQRNKLRERMLSDSIYGHASSDGRLIFFVPSPGAATASNEVDDASDITTSDPSDRRLFNEMVAIDSELSGLLRWRVGGPNGFDEPKLAKAFFIGEALPVEGVLYCCCVLDNAIQLVALDSKSGKLRWSKMIAGYEAEDFNSNRSRRLAGVSPSYADGKIVCLTGTGAVVALDVSTRTLLWGYEYKQGAETTLVSDDSGYADAMQDAWRDSQVVIANGMVFLTPVLSREMICLDLDDGLGVWFEEDGFMPERVNRGSSLYMAGINRDQIICVGTRNIRAIDSFTGRETWVLDLEIDDLPSGRGYMGDDSLFLPTANRKMLRIDLVNGVIAESVSTGRVLGNLSRVKGDVVSHGLDHVASFPEYGASKRSIEGLPAADLNEDQKFIKAQTLIQRGDLEAGLDMLTELAAANPLPKYAEFLALCATLFQMERPVLSLRALDWLKQHYPNFDVEELEQGRAIAKLRTGEFDESVKLSIDQLESKIEDIKSAGSAEIVDEIFKTLPAALVDGEVKLEPATEVEFEGVESIAFENRNDRIKYSDFGWHRTRLLLGVRGLESSNPESSSSAKTRIGKLVEENIELPAPQLDRLLARIPSQMLDDKTIEMLVGRFLKESRFLSALQYSNAALAADRTGAERFRLLNAEIYIAGNDLARAADALRDTNQANLDDVGLERLAKLQNDLATRIDLQSGSIKPTSTWANGTAPITDPGNVVLSVISKRQSPTRYRLPFVFDLATESSLRKLKMYFCPWIDQEIEFELRNSRGNEIQRSPIRDPKYGTSFAYTSQVDADVQGSVAELTLNRTAYYVDWFKVIAGSGGSLWRSRHDRVVPQMTAFSGGRETVIGSGNEVYCYETISGKLIWSRTLEDRVSRVVANGSRFTTWSEEGQRFNTFETATGKLLRSIKSKRFIVAKTLVDQMVMNYPIRKGELSKEEEAKFTDPDGVKNPAEVARRFAGFDSNAGRITWSKIFTSKSLMFYLANELCNLDRDGKLIFMDLKSGEVSCEIDLPLSDLEKENLESISVYRHRAGWVVSVKCKSNFGGFVRGKSSYQYYSLHRSQGSGPVFLLDESRESLLWKSPVRIEQMEYLESQPFDSPAIMFGRHIERTEPGKGDSHYLQTVLLEPKTGKLKYSGVIGTLESYNGYAIEWKKSESGVASNTLVISTAVQVQEIKFGQDKELPPGPLAHLTFNAIDFFEDPLFEKVRSEVVDSRVEEFRARAEEAEKQRLEKQAKSAADFKKRMGVGGAQ
jgi:outer membrane protein assembly factor BamB/tetratricopeptide (TPR) repeat protein